MLLLSGREGYSLYSARRWVWYYKDLAYPKYWSAWSCKSNFWLHVYKTAVHRADVRTHTCRELAREWSVETEWEMKEPKEPEPAPAQNGTASGHEWAAVV